MSIAQTQTVPAASHSKWTPALPKHRTLITTELALLAGMLVLAAIVKAHPGPLPGELSMVQAVQHLLRPIPVLVTILSFISTITWPLYVAVQLAVIIFLLVLCRRWLDIGVVVMTLGAADGTNFLISQLDRRPRPTGAGLYVQQHITIFFSFPSGHVEHALAFLGILLFLTFQVRRPWVWLWIVRVPLIAMIVLMGPARLLTGEHWPSDVLAGLMWGGFWLIAAIQVYRWAVHRWPQWVPANERKNSQPDWEVVQGARRPSPATTLAPLEILRSVAATPMQGLSEGEVRTRRLNGQNNTVPATVNRSYAQILRHNFLTFINISLFGLGVVLLLLGRFMDALSAVGLILFVTLVSAAQQIRAKRILDRRVVAAATRVTVIREGHERSVTPEELVQGDLIKVEPGARIVVDGRIVCGEWMAIDESLLSGRPQYTLKQEGDHLISGSVCVGGNGMYVAERVGDRSVIQRVTVRARIARRSLTPLQKQINFAFIATLLAALYIELLLVVRAVVSGADIADSVEQSAVIATLVPEALVLSIAVAYAIGAVRVLRFGALAQESNAIESLSNLSVLCLDKTGTLTTNTFWVERLQPIGMSEEQLRLILADVTASATTSKIGEAIAANLKGRRRRVVSEIPFSPERRWSALGLDDPGDETTPPLHGIYVMGAPEVLQSHLEPAGRQAASDSLVDEWTAQGLLVLQVAQVKSSTDVADLGNDSHLPQGLVSIGFVGLREELRPDAQETIAALVKTGVEIKIISGDHPQTVAAVATRAGLDSQGEPVSGFDFMSMNETELESMVASTSIFGRMAAEQKGKLIAVLRKRGHYVGMVGDGLNDVPALKKAHVGIATQSGSDVTRDTADVVLLNDSLSTLPRVVAEGQRIVNGMQPTLNLYLTRIVASALVILSALAVAEVFPLRLRHGTILTILAVGVPAVFLSLWAKPGPLGRDRLMRQHIHFVLPAAVISSAIGLLLFYAVLMLEVLPFVHGNAHFTRSQMQSVLQKDLPTAQTELVSFLILTGLILVIFAVPPTKWWAGGSDVSGDWRPTLLALGLAIGFGVALEVPLFRSLFGLAPLGIHHFGAVVGAAILWLFVVRAVWRAELGERVLSLDRNPGAWYRNAMHGR